MIAKELKVRRGEPVREAWKRLLRWVDTLKIIPDDEIEIRTTKHGTIVRVRDRHLYHHPFRVVASGQEARVAPGTINDVVPVMKDAGGLRRIDNRDEKGAREKKKNPPALKLDFKKASKDGRIFISLRYKTPAENSAKPKLPEIVQTDSAKGPLDGYGYYPLGCVMLTDDGKAIDQTFQIVHHNLRVSFQERKPTNEELKDNPDAKPIGRYLFYPV